MTSVQSCQNPPSKARPRSVQVWVSEEERNLIERAAANENRSLSSYAKIILLKNLPVVPEL